MTEQDLQIDTEVRAALLHLRDVLADELRRRYPQCVSYWIGDVARWLGVTPATLRWWETQFGAFLRPMRSAKPYGTAFGRTCPGRRHYSHKDAITLGCIQHLMRIELYTTAGALRQLRMARDAQRTS